MSKKPFNIGQILMQFGVLTWPEVQEVAKRQDQLRQGGMHVMFGEVAVNMGFCTAADVDRAVCEQDRFCFSTRKTGERMLAGLQQELAALGI